MSYDSCGSCPYVPNPCGLRTATSSSSTTSRPRAPPTARARCRATTSRCTRTSSGSRASRPIRRARAQHRARSTTRSRSRSRRRSAAASRPARAPVLNVMRPPSGSSIAVFGAGGGRPRGGAWRRRSPAARRSSRSTSAGAGSSFALDVGATHVVDASQVRRGRGDSRAHRRAASTSRSRRPACRRCCGRRSTASRPRGVCGVDRCAALRRRGEPRRQHDSRRWPRDARHRRGGERPVGVPAEARRALAARAVPGGPAS